MFPKLEPSCSCIIPDKTTVSVLNDYEMDMMAKPVADLFYENFCRTEIDFIGACYYLLPLPRNPSCLQATDAS